MQVKLAFDCVDNHEKVCTSVGQTLFAFTKNTWIGETRASCHIINIDDGMLDVKVINKMVQRTSGQMKAMSWASKGCK